MAKICSSRILNHQTVQNMVRRSWNIDNPAKVGDTWPNLYTISSYSFSRVEEILLNLLWNILGYQFNIKLWNVDLAIHEIDFRSAEFWVQLHNLPLEFLDESNLNMLGACIGMVLDVDIPIVQGSLIRPFPQVRVPVNLSKPFKIGVWVPRHNDRVWIHFCYEK